ncbi:MAG: MgtC/SapB family protein [Phycisphaeraceae bacterium]|nr:MgtC/SapB family protein [Phycisphaeraceae bacterium]
MDLPGVFLDLAIAVAGGLLVGLQRERSKSELAGIRTFPLIAILGALCALLARATASFPTDAAAVGVPGVMLIASGFVAISIVILTGNLVRAAPSSKHPESHGVTTEVAILVIFSSGVLIGLHMHAVGVAVAAMTAVLLHLKASLHRFTKSLTDDDVRAVMQFAVIALIIFPVIPDRAMGPYDAINPYKLWLMVVLVTGISLCGYVALRIFGSRAGTLLAAFLGGLVSSTATTVSLSRLAKSDGRLAGSAAPAIAISNSVMLARVMVLVFVAARESAMAILPALGALLGASIVGAAAGVLASRRNVASGEAIPTENQKNPTELKSALIFAALFAAVQILVIGGKEQFGRAGIFAIAALSGLTDMDAITLSTAGLARSGELLATNAAIAIVIAALVNTVVKLAIAGAMGGRSLAIRLSAILLLPLVTGVAVIVYFFIAGANPGIS